MSKKQNAFYALTFIGALVATTAPAAAALTSSSSAYGVKADIKVLNGKASVLASVGHVSGEAPDSYDKSRTVVAVNETVTLAGNALAGIYEHIGTGVINTTAKSGVPDVVSASAGVLIDGLDVTFKSKVLGVVPLLSLGIDADTITSNTAVGVGPSGLWSSGSSNLAGINITGGLLGLLNLDFGLLANAGPNTRIDLGAVSLYLNEQQEVRNGTSDIFAYTNALRISLNDYVLGGRLLNGDIVVGHSEASITGYVPPVVNPPAGAVPEPATWAMMILGFGLIGAGARQRRARVARVTA